VIGIAAVALGSYVVHVARTQGSISVLLAGGAVLIAGGIIVILVTSAGTYGAVSLSKIMLGIVSSVEPYLNQLQPLSPLA
jgi:hypothetical protein